MTRFIVIGVGAIGGTVGGALADAGHRVAFVARGHHGEVLRDRGLHLALPSRELDVRVPTVAHLGELELAADDVLLVCIKSYGTVALLAEIAGLPVGADRAGDVLPVFLLQNGVANEPAALRWFARVHGVMVALPAGYLDDGEVTAYGAPSLGVLEVGRYPAGSDDDDRFVADALGTAGFAAAVRDDVMPWKRAKLVQNLGNAIEAACAPSEAEPRRAVIAALAAEAYASFAAAGLAVIPEPERAARVSAHMHHVEVAGRVRSGTSTMQSLQRGTGAVETDWLNGEVVALGRAHGIPTPLNEALQGRMADIVAGRAEPGRMPVEELLRTR